MLVIYVFRTYRQRTLTTQLYNLFQTDPYAADQGNQKVRIVPWYLIHNTVPYNTIKVTIQYNTNIYNTNQSNTMQHKTMQYNAKTNNTIQHHTENLCYQFCFRINLFDTHQYRSCK